MASTSDPFYENTMQALRVLQDDQELKDICAKAQQDLQELFDAELAKSGEKIACCSGCSYCCHLKVDVEPRDIFLVADFIRTQFSPERQAAILQRAQANWKRIEPMTLTQHFQAGLPCPLLEDGKCSVYAVRPSACRRAHSRRVEPCRESFEHPEVLDKPDDTVPSLSLAAATAHFDISTAFDESDYDSRPYDLNAALIEALKNPEAESRWQEGEAAFPDRMLAKDWEE